ncbi:hypothetical protein PInf_001473 [Phytophthora infestans]|nr:hypothetical protein PInf_001473 [Phytophthora infestans]
MVKRSNPEVVARLRQRRKQRGESLVEYAQKLREITHQAIRLWTRHRSWTFNEAVNAALDQVGEYCESYGVDLGTVMKVQDERDAAVGVVSVLVPDVTMMLYSCGAG